MNETARLAGFIAGTRLRDLPGAVVAATKVYVLDSLAAGLVGSTMPWAEATLDLALENGRRGPCTVLGTRARLSPSYASLVNGVMIGGFECDHAFVAGSAHPGAAVVPAALAAGQWQEAGGEAFLVAVALGYEVLCRIGLAATRAVEDERGFHGPGTNAPFGAAATAARLLGLDARQTANALGIAASHGAGLLEFAREGAMTKRLHVGRGAQMGLESAFLTQRGFTGPSTALEGERGFLRVYSPSPRTELLVDGLGERWVMLGITVKAYTCHASFHAVIEGACRMREELRSTGEPWGIGRVLVAGAGWMMEPRFAAREPTTVLGAQYSLPFSLALALCRGMDDPLVFNESALQDSQVRDLAKRIQIVEDRRYARRASGAVAELTVEAGPRLCTTMVSDWKGAPTNPYTYEEMAGKFRRYAAARLEPRRVEAVVRMVAEMERLDSVDRLGRSLAPRVEEGA